MSVDADLDNRAEVKFAGFPHIQVALCLPSCAVVLGGVAVHSAHLRGVRYASLLSGRGPVYISWDSAQETCLFSLKLTVKLRNSSEKKPHVDGFRGGEVDG